MVTVLVDYYYSSLLVWSWWPWKKETSSECPIIQSHPKCVLAWEKVGRRGVIFWQVHGGVCPSGALKSYHALVDLIPPVGSGAAFLANAAKDASKTSSWSGSGFAAPLLLRLVVKLEMFDVMPLPSQEWILKLKEEEKLTNFELAWRFSSVYHISFFSMTFKRLLSKSESLECFQLLILRLADYIFKSFPVKSCFPFLCKKQIIWFVPIIQLWS